MALGPFCRDEKCRAIGLPTGITERARRFRLLLNAYGLEPDLGIMQAGMERLREGLEHMRKLVSDGSEWEIELCPMRTRVQSRRLSGTASMCMMSL